MKKILAVDDDPDILFTLQAIASVGNFQMETLNDGHKALALLKKEPFDLAIVDYYMPEMNGMELVRRIREFNVRIPILVLTVDESMDIANQFMAVGATDFATKPIRVADLISRINVHLHASSVENPDWMEEIDIPKGMSAVTLHSIVDYLETAKQPESINYISEKTGLAYQTVHRYLSFLSEQGVVQVDLLYGKVGRPVKRYFRRP
ncbi:MAG: response regulator [Limnochordia bacterium]|jgi:two-component system response regulator DctR